MASLPDFLWYRDQGHDDCSGVGFDGSGVRIAHLDTGYDPSHGTVPENTSKTQRNFVDAAFPEDATDRTTSGILTNVGHGTGTLSILAGKAIAGSNPVPAVGIATRAGVVPIRVANSVVLFENSAIAVPAQMAQ